MPNFLVSTSTDPSGHGLKVVDSAGTSYPAISVSILAGDPSICYLGFPASMKFSVAAGATGLTVSDSNGTTYPASSFDLVDGNPPIIYLGFTDFSLATGPAITAALAAAAGGPAAGAAANAPAASAAAGAGGTPPAA